MIAFATLTHFFQACGMKAQIEWEHFLFLCSWLLLHKSAIKQMHKSAARTWNRKEVDLCENEFKKEIVTTSHVVHCEIQVRWSGRSREMCYSGEDCKSCSLPQELEPLHCGNNNRLLDWGFLLKTPPPHNISSTRTLHCWLILGHIRPPKVNPLFKARSENTSTIFFETRDQMMLDSYFPKVLEMLDELFSCPQKGQ